ncbi:MAG: phage holin family protein [Ruminococcus sp.]|nr:phage holin family protein [Ruminococcus sp.]
MSKLKIICNSIGGISFSFIAYLLGGIDKPIIILLTAIGIDYITGICKGIYRKDLNSIMGLKGIIKKVGYLMIVMLATLMDKIIGQDMAIRTLVIYFFVANEGISIIENWGLMGLPLPKKLSQILEQLKNEEQIK